MYLYNDAVWLSEKLKDFAAEWKDREDLPARAYGMVRLDPEVKILESFGKRAYTNELNAQRTVINDLLAGESFLTGLGGSLRTSALVRLEILLTFTKVHKTSFNKATKPTKASAISHATSARKLHSGRKSSPTLPGPPQPAPS